MNNKLKSLVKRTIIAATAALSGTPVVASAKQGAVSPMSELSPAKLSQETFKKDSKHPKLVLERPTRANLGAYLLAAWHASHSSHSSHASHASHVSGYTQPSSPKPTPPPDQGQQQPPKNPSSRTLYKLGDRTLRSGMTGTDVAELQQRLIKKGYKVRITAEYDSTTENAVKKFQKKSGVEASGEVDALTLFYLLQK